jgi:threo-3-hydroxy-L-aspartate ammonia-lyase
VSEPSVVTIDDVRAAAERIAGHVHRTPVLTSSTLDGRVGAMTLLKAEHLQRAGAFKIRGATNAIRSLEPDRLAHGVVAFSSGNHAQAVALAAREAGAAATIVMPSDAPAAKLEATRAYGATIVTFDRARDDREAIAAVVADRDGATLIRPYDDPGVIAGQGTCALELADQAGAPDVLVVPVGGGGLIAGCATVAESAMPRTRVIGVEPDVADDTCRSVAAGARVEIAPPDTIADGLAVTTPGRLTFPVIQRLVDDIVTVRESQIVEAMVFLFDRLKIVVEPSGAVGVAALLAGCLPDVTGRTVGVILSGGNVDAARFRSLTAGGVAGSRGG